MKALHVTTLILATSFAAGCDELPFFPGNFDVRVEDTSGQPVAGATVVGGIDWSFYHVVTDRHGVAPVPRGERGRAGRILAVNHFPLEVASLRAQTYRLQPTPLAIAEMGRVEGAVLRLTAAELLTFSHYGDVRAYGYSDAGVVERSRVRIPLPTSFAGAAELFGDELWILRGDLVIEAWSVNEPAAPVKLREIAGLGLWLARQDSLVVVRRGPHTEIWAVPAAGAPRRLADVPGRSIQAELVGSALYLRLLEHTWDDVELLVLDITDPAAPRTTHRETFAGYGHLSFGDGRALLTRTAVQPGADAEHLVLDLANPSVPVRAGTLIGDAFPTALLGGGLAIGFTSGPRVDALLQVAWQAGRVRVLATTDAETAHVWPYSNPLPDGALAGTTAGTAGAALVLSQRLWRLPTTSP
jgi:hypothetical protein